MQIGFIRTVKKPYHKNAVRHAGRAMGKGAQIIPAFDIAAVILEMRGQKVMLDADLARIYGVTTKMLNRAVKRNNERFPVDFMFQLTVAELENLRCQNGTSSFIHGGRRYLPYAFTEHGCLQAANILKSERAAAMSVYVIRAFVSLREWAVGYKELARKVAELEMQYDRQFSEIFAALRQLMSPPPPKELRHVKGFLSGE